MSYAVSSKIVTTRKPHRCRYCGEKIAVGEKCERRAGFGYGEVWTIHMHPECEIETREWDSGDWECNVPGDYERPKNANMDAI